MTELVFYDAVTKPSSIEKNQIIDFLFENLDEYGDSKEDIYRCLDYATKEIASFGGKILVLKEENTIRGVVVVNRTGMSGYIPENILVYIAVHKESRGNGYGKIMMQRIIDLTKGDIALHVEADNPARFLYEKMGFTNPYLEMRLKK
jgi:GNAT superfamily N-acetyltransferase